jgi:hypothetical protein
MDGWIAFWILLSIVIISFGGLMFRNYLNISESSSSSIIAVLKAVILFIPKILPIGLLLIGPLIDIVNNKGLVSSIPTIATLSTLLVLKGLSAIWSPVPYFENLSGDSSSFWCTLPGFEYFENPFIPSSILTSTIVGFYYLFWASKINQQQMAIGATVAVAIVGSAMQFSVGNCEKYYKTFFGLGGNETIFYSLLIGTIVAGITFGSSTVNGMVNNPFYGLETAINTAMPPKGTPSSIGRCPLGQHNTGTTSSPICVSQACNTNYTWADASWGITSSDGCVADSVINSNVGPGGPAVSSRQSAAPQGGEQTFVAELYKNGQMITQSIGL